MGFDRFKKLERARPDGPDAAQAQSSMRFGKIEARKEQPVAAPDPFAPPPDGAEEQIELADGDRSHDERVKAEKKSWAQQKLDEERQRIAELQMQQEAREGRLDLAIPGTNALLDLSVRDRALVSAGLLVGIAVLALTITPILWGLAPLVILVFVATLFAKTR
jgi:hypothetical protein